MGMQIISLLVLLGASCWAQDSLGTWKMNAEKSRFHGPPPKEMTVRYESQAEADIWTFYQVRADGNSETSSQTLHFDGNPYCCGDVGLEERPDTVVSRKPDARTAEVFYKKSGRVARRMVRTVSADGKEMTLDIRILPEKGPAVERRLVFERQAGKLRLVEGEFNVQTHKWRLTALFAMAVTAQAQTSRGTVTGAVLDSTGAVITGASVTLTGVETGARRSTASNEAGIYRFDAVDLGSYELGVTHPGFRSFLGSGIRVEANRVTTFDPRLEVGVSETRLEVSGESSEILVRDGPLRGGNFQPREVRDLPLISLNPLSLARTLPGVTQVTGSALWTSDGSTEFAINGQRTRGNNYLLDGADNNEMQYSGAGQPFTMADAVEEVSVQTGNFGVEFGRAGGGVFNLVTKSGANSLHGTLLWRYQSQRFNSVSNLDKLNGLPKSVFSNNVYGFTVGGPVRKNKTFFFGGFQRNDRHSTGNFRLVVPAADAVPRLRALFPSNPRLDLYLNPLGDLRGSGAPFALQLGVDPQTGIDRGTVQFGSASCVLPSRNDGPERLVRVDHYASEAHRLSWRYVSDSRATSPSSECVNPTFPGYSLDDNYQAYNFLFADSYTFGPSFTNEFRFSYGRQDADICGISPRSVPLARTNPWISIANISSPGVPQTSQFRHPRNLLFQETQTKLSGRHAFRYGVEFLRQTATQLPSGARLGNISYQNSIGYSAFANFLDDFSGPSAITTRVFGADVFHPDSFRQTYFFQDNWKATPTLALTLGLRYENFGQPANAVRYPAFTGFDASRFFVRDEVNRDNNNNFGPAFGLAWSPAPRSGWLGKMFGERKTVWRGGYQISYDAFFTQMVSLALSSMAPNASSPSTTAPNTGRGLANWFAYLPKEAGLPSLLDTQNGAIEKDLRSPYTERWSFGFQRQLPDKFLLDVSYVGSASHKLTTRANFNPRQLNGQRLHPDFGQRLARTSQGNSSYHALQGRLERRFARGFHLTASYTWSRMIDSTSEGVGGGSNQEDGGNLTSVPASQGGMKLDHGLSDYDRAHRFTLVYLWEVPGPRTGLWKHAFG